MNEVADGSCQLLVTSPPYNIGKSYERLDRRSLTEYVEWMRPIVTKACLKVSETGHVCWQAGNYVSDGSVYPLDYVFFEMISSLGFRLRNRIIWHFNSGLHATRRFSGRYETLLWFSKSDDYFFNLEPVRVPQLYPGKRHSGRKGEKAGLPSGNPNGKNPSDYWTFDADEVMRGNGLWKIPNVKANHPEKTTHPCQFPSELVERCLLALTRPGDTVLDPFAGAGTTTLAADLHQRSSIAIDQSETYLELAKQRLAQLKAGNLRTRPMGLAIRTPVKGEKVSSIPEEWKTAAE